MNQRASRDKTEGSSIGRRKWECKNHPLFGSGKASGGFGCSIGHYPHVLHTLSAVQAGAESHAGQTFCCVGALSITGSLHHVDKDLLGWWLCDCQDNQTGGLNGRPEKLPDVSYSWRALSSLITIDRVHWINEDKLIKFILDCQDIENGGISDRPDDAVDVYHTYFGV